MLEKSLFSKVDQIGMVVQDMHKAVEYYQSLGIGPFEPLTRGAPTIEKKVLNKLVAMDSINLKIRVANMSTVQLELIEPGQEESLWRQFLRTKGEGINHLGFFVADIEKETAELEHKGFKAIFSSRQTDGGGCAYFDTTKFGGIFIELIQW